MASTNKFKSKWKIKAVLDNIDDLKELNLKEKSAVYQKPPFDSDKILKLVQDEVEHYFKDEDSLEENIVACQQISKNIKDSLKTWPHLKRYRIVAVVSLVEKNNQGISYRTKHVVDPQTDNLIKYYAGFPQFFIIVCVYLVFQD